MYIKVNDTHCETDGIFLVTDEFKIQLHLLTPGHPENNLFTSF